MMTVMQSAPKKRDLSIKRIYATRLETHLMYTKGDMFIFAVLEYKNGTGREPIEVGKQILADAKEIESTNFIMRQI